MQESVQFATGAAAQAVLRNGVPLLYCDCHRSVVSVRRESRGRKIEKGEREMGENKRERKKKQQHKTETKS